VQRSLKEKSELTLSSQPGVLRGAFEGFLEDLSARGVRWGSEVSGIVPDRERLNSSGLTYITVV
jgi:hypothetical protein